MLSTQAKLTACSGVRVTPFSGSSRRCARPAGSLAQPSWVTKGSFLVEVEVGEVESEEVAIQRFQRAVTQTLVINELRRRRRVMTKIEALQAKQNEKGLIKKLNIDPMSWKEQYGDNMDAAPFAEYFQGDNDYSEIASNVDPLGEDFFFDAVEGNTNSGFGAGNMYGGGSGYMAGGQYSNYGTFGQGYQQDAYSNFGAGYATQPGYSQGEFLPAQDYTQAPQQDYQSIDYTQQPAAPQGDAPAAGY